MKRLNKQKLVVAITMGLGLVAVHQVATAQGSAQRGLEEIIVTAQKREQSLQQVPIAASAFAGDALEMRFAKDMTDLTGAAPNISLELEGISNYSAAFYIRGQGVLNRGAFIDPAVAVVVDGVTDGRVSTSLVDFLDVESIEVLRGPQGTLQGRNATAGAVLLKHFKPNVNEVEGNVGVLVGNYGRQDVKGMINIPIQEGVSAFRVAGKFTETDGFYKNIFGGKSKRIGGQERISLMPSFHVEQDKWNLTARGNYSRYRDDATVLVPLNHCGEDPRVNPGSLLNDLFVRLVAMSDAPGAGPEAAYRSCAKKATDKAFRVNQDRDLPVGSEMDLWGLKLEYNYHLDNLGTLTYVGGYQDTEEYNAIDSDTGPLKILHNEERIEHWQNSHEIRFASEFSEKVDMIIGALWMQQEYDLYRVNHPSMDNAYSGQKNEQYGVFAHTEWHLTDKLTLVGAGRYTIDEKDFSICPLGAAVCGGRTQKDKKRWTDFSPRVGVNYQFNDDLFGYFYAARGFRAGGYNGEAGSISAAGPYDPEENTTYEVGIKWDALDNRVRINATYFRTEVEGLQRSISRTGLDDVVEQVTQNAADAKIDGVELELTALVGERLTLNATVGWLDARYNDFCQDMDGPRPNHPSLVPCAPAIGDAQPVDLTGLPLARAPEWTYRLNAVYEAEIGPGIAAFSLEWVYTDELMTLDQGAPMGTSLGLDNFDGTKVDPMRDSTEIFNGSITWRDHGQRYKVSLYGKNLTNELYYRRLSYAPPILSFGTINNPREYGVEFSYSF